MSGAAEARSTIKATAWTASTTASRGFRRSWPSLSRGLRTKAASGRTSSPDLVKRKISVEDIPVAIPPRADDQTLMTMQRGDTDEDLVYRRPSRASFTKASARTFCSRYTCVKTTAPMARAAVRASS